MYYPGQAQPWYVSSNVRRSFAKVLGDLVGGMAVGEHHKRASFRIPRVDVKGDEHRTPGLTDGSFPAKKIAFVQYLPAVSTARLALLSSCFLLTANGVVYLCRFDLLFIRSTSDRKQCDRHTN